jgi:NAD dependent epimerase/dehydratase
MNWNSKHVLVTGAGGFIGSHLCEALVRTGADVTAMIHYSSRPDWGNLELAPSQIKSSLKVVAGNIEDTEFVLRQVNGQQVIFHLAALIAIPYSYAAPRSYITTNVLGTLNVLEAARSCGVEKVVHTSTSETYGTAIYTPIDENHPLQGQSPYSASKIGADKLAESYYRSFGLPVATIRPFNTFGPRQSARAIIPTIITQALARPEIRLGSTEPVRDFNFVQDVADAFIKVAESSQCAGDVVNVGSGRGITIGDLAAEILRLIGCSKPIVSAKDRFRPVDSEVFKLICDNSRVERLTGWKQTHSLEQGLSKAIEFVSNHLTAYKADQFTI